MSTESAIKAEERATTPPPNSTTNIARLMSITMMSTRRCSALRPSSAIVSRFDEQHASAIIERSEEHTSELQSLMRISYAVFCLKKKKKHNSARLHSNTRELHIQRT